MKIEDIEVKVLQERGKLTLIEIINKKNNSDVLELFIPKIDPFKKEKELNENLKKINYIFETFDKLENIPAKDLSFILMFISLFIVKNK